MKIESKLLDQLCIEIPKKIISISPQAVKRNIKGNSLNSREELKHARTILDISASCELKNQGK